MRKAVAKEEDGLIVLDLKNSRLSNLEGGSDGDWHEIDPFLCLLLQKTTRKIQCREMNEHIEKTRHLGNRRNGYQEAKLLRTPYGTFKYRAPRDRLGTFNSKFQPKRKGRTRELDARILSLAAMGISQRDIASHLETYYKIDMSASTISNIVADIYPEIQGWQDRPLHTAAREAQSKWTPIRGWPAVSKQLEAYFGPRMPEQA